MGGWVDGKRVEAGGHEWHTYTVRVVLPQTGGSDWNKCVHGGSLE